MTAVAVPRSELDQLKRRLLDPGCPRDGVVDVAGLRLRYTDPVVLYYQIELILYAGQYGLETARPAPRILDCGANLGVASLYFKSVHPGARITAFEPDPGLCDLLRENLDRNGAGDVRVVEAAVWHTAGTVGMFRDGKDGGRVGRPGEDAVGPPHEVRAVRLSDYLDEDVALLKLDVEGAELDVLREAEPRLGCVDRLVLEYHGWSGERQHLHSLLDLLDRAGYRYFPHHLMYYRGAPPAAIDTDALFMLLVYADRDARDTRCAS